jgi:two-component system phosphate regulon response regulator PhoB
MAQQAQARVRLQKLVVIEDEPDVGALLEYVLGKEGFDVAVARDGHEAIEVLDRERPDLVILDLMLPDMSGLEILQRIRKARVDGVPRVIILSAKKDEEDRVKGFELGADDYVVKPFSPKELVYRIRTTLGREPSDVDPSQILTVGPIRLDEETHEVHVGGRSIHLTLTEFRLLADMMRNQGRVRSRETLMSQVWDYDSQAMSRTVDTHIRRLRSKLGSAAVWLRTVRGVGYRIKDPESD